MRLRWLLLAPLAWLMPSASNAVTPVTVNVDLQAGYLCPVAPRPVAVVRFLRREWFRAADLRVIPKWSGGADLIVAGYDSRRWSVSFFGPEGAYAGQGWYNVQVASPAPTRHDTALENRVLEFIRRDLNCTLRQVERHEESQADMVEQGFATLKADVDAAYAH